MEEVETDWFITSSHPMRKENYISFVAFATGDRLQVIKQYPSGAFSCASPPGARDAAVVRPGGRPAVPASVTGPRPFRHRLDTLTLLWYSRGRRQYGGGRRSSTASAASFPGPGAQAAADRIITK